METRLGLGEFGTPLMQLSQCARRDRGLVRSGQVRSRSGQVRTRTGADSLKPILMSDGIERGGEELFSGQAQMFINTASTRPNCDEN